MTLIFFSGYVKFGKLFQKPTVLLQFGINFGNIMVSDCIWLIHKMDLTALFYAFNLCYMVYKFKKIIFFSDFGVHFWCDSYVNSNVKI